MPETPTPEAPPTTYEWGVKEGALFDWEMPVRTDRPGEFDVAPMSEEFARTMVQAGWLCERRLVRRLPGSDSFELVPFEPPQLPPPSDEDLKTKRYGGVMVTGLGEDDVWLVALGHVHPADMAQAASLWRKDLMGSDGGYKPADVKHVWAVRREAWGYDADWFASWSPEDARLGENRFALTVVETGL